MFKGRVLLVLSAEESPLGRWLEAVVNAFPRDERPTLTTLAAQSLIDDPRRVDGHDIGWLLVGEGDDKWWYSVMAVMQDRRIPTMVSRFKESLPAGGLIEPGVVAAPAGSDPTLIHTVIRSLMSQVQGMRELLMETNLLRTEHASLCGQIDRMDEELRLAAKLQREFLPTRMPTFAGIEILAFSRPASYVSGDIHDVIRLDESHVGLFIADAVGHGVPAALMTVYIKQSLQTKEIGRHLPHGYRVLSPSQTITRLNQTMIDLQMPNARTSTAWYGVLDCKTMKLTFARAGHPLPIVLNTEGNIRQLESEGAILGVFPEEEFEERTVQLDPGDRLLIYSDGFETAFQSNNGKIASRQSLNNDMYVQEFRDMALGPLDQALTRMVTRLDQQVGSLNQVDDLTVVCMRVADAVNGSVPRPIGAAANASR